MNINGLFGNLGNSGVSSVVGAESIGASTTQSSVPPPMSGAATATISTPAQFFSEMQQLSQQNPAEFKTVAAQIATTFQDAAAKATGPEAKLLTKLANDFSQAAQTGTLQRPQDAQGAQSGQAGQSVQGAQAGQSRSGTGHHHHHHGGGSASASNPVQQAFQAAMTALEQALSGTSTPTTPLTSTSSTGT